MNIWLTMLLAGLATFIIRLSFIQIIGHRSIPPLLQRALRLVPPAVLTAIIFPEVFLSSGHLDLSFGNARLLAGLLATLVAWRTRNAVLTIVVGMLSVWLFTWLIH
jgi:branched-subunit amino acid transport protein